MWLWRTREKYLSALTLLQDDGQAFRSAPGQIHRPDRTETVPLVNYIKSPLGLGERPQGERPQPAGPPARVSAPRPTAPNRSRALQRESPARGRERERAGDEIPLLAEIDLAEIFRLRVGVEEMVEERRAGGRVGEVPRPGAVVDLDERPPR